MFDFRFKRQFNKIFDILQEIVLLKIIFDNSLIFGNAEI